MIRGKFLVKFMTLQTPILLGKELICIFIVPNKHQNLVFLRNSEWNCSGGGRIVEGREGENNCWGKRKEADKE
jgi:hypothetical protein